MHHYVLMNIECDQVTLDELEHAFKFNDAVLRHLTIGMKRAVLDPSPMMRGGEEKPRSAAPVEVAAESSGEMPAEAAGATS